MVSCCCSHRAAPALCCGRAGVLYDVCGWVPADRGRAPASSSPVCLLQTMPARLSAFYGPARPVRRRPRSTPAIPSSSIGRFATLAKDAPADPAQGGCGCGRSSDHPQFRLRVGHADRSVRPILRQFPPRHVRQTNQAPVRPALHNALDPAQRTLKRTDSPSARFA